MCMLTYFPPTVLADTERLTNGTLWNRDGHGFAIIAGKRMIIRKSFDAEYLIAEFARLRAKHPEGPAMFHSRMGTHGSMGKANIHPFRVANDHRTIVAHNGILPPLMQPYQKGDKRSDTRFAADGPMTKWFGPLTEQASRDELGKYIGGFNKLVFLTIDPAFDQQAYIINEDRGEWADGVWYSNADYRESRYALTAYDDWSDAGDCAYCSDLGEIDPATGFCTICDACVDCYEQREECLCFIPTTKKQKQGAATEDEYANYESWWKAQDAAETRALLADAIEAERVEEEALS